MKRGLVLFLLLVIFIIFKINSSVAFAQVHVFDPSRLDYRVGANPWSIADGDFNNDGNQDVVAANLADDNVTVRLGNGDGTLGSPQSFNVGHYPEGIIVGYFNNDDDLDLVTSNFGSSNISLLLGNGDGTFSSRSDFNVGNTPRALAEGDFNNDGKPDIAVTNRDDSTVSVLINSGDGVFNDAVNYFSGGIKPRLIITSDLNNDQVPDLAFVDAEQKLQDPDMVGILLGNGDGTFQDAVIEQIDIIGLFQATSSLAAPDFNEDGNTDLVIAVHVTGSDENDYLSLLKGNGDGTFTIQPSVDLGIEGYKSFYLISKDLNNDSHEDLAVTGSHFNNVGIYTGNGDGSFKLSDFYTTGLYPRWLSVTDLNNDLIPDIVSCNEGADSLGSISLLMGKGEGLFIKSPTFDMQYQQSYSCASGDFNDDGITDLAVDCWDSSNVADGHLNILFGNGDGTFDFSDSYPAGKSARTVVVNDFDGDDDVDIAVVNDRSNNIIVYLNNGDGLFQQGVSYQTDLNPQSLAAGDFNGDNIPDLVCTNWNGNNFSFFPGNGDGTFQNRTDFPAIEGPREIISQDINGDEIEDIIILSSRYEHSINKISVHTCNGDGTFNTPEVINVMGSFIWNMKGGDFNKDGDYDLVVTDIETNKIMYFQGNNGTFDSAILVGKVSEPRGLEVCDINSDGNLDLAVTSAVNSNVSLFYGDGKGNFNLQDQAYGSEGAWNVLAADFDGDTDKDLVLTTGIGGEANISFLLNRTDVVNTEIPVYPEIPDNYSLKQNFPNPFNPSTTIEFTLPENVTNVKLYVYNILCEKVVELVHGPLNAGTYRYIWNAEGFASGTYFYELITGKFTISKKMILLK